MSEKHKSKSVTDAIESIEERVNTLGRAVFGSERFGQISNAGLSVGTRLTKNFSDRMGKGLHLYNMPTREDVTAIAEKCAQIEERLLNMETLLQEFLQQRGAAPVPGPPRTRKPRSKQTATRTRKKKSAT